MSVDFVEIFMLLPAPGKNTVPVLVSGATGFIGRYVVSEFVRRGHDVVAHDVKMADDPQLPDGVETVRGDISDWTDVLNVVDSHEVTGIVTLAVADTTYTNERPAVGLRTNVGGTLNVLEAARLFDLEKVVYLSSGSVHGQHDDLDEPISETDINFPPSGVYPVTKLAGEGLCKNYTDLHGVDTTALRPSRVYGPAESRIDYSLPIDELVRTAIAGDDLVYETGADTPIDYTYVKDIARATAVAYETDYPDRPCYNISQGELTTPETIGQLLVERFPDIDIDIGDGLWPGILERPMIEDSTYKPGLRPALDISQAESDLDWQPAYPIEAGIDDYVREVRS
jgi:nucleoside-diphosphate-sugar epimerase